jgi:hypothetical protein
MRVYLSSFWAPKAGNTDEEYEDAYHPKWSGERQLDRLKVAVADGASEGSFSNRWADMLVRSFGRSASLRFGDTFNDALSRWEAWLPKYLDRRTQSGRPIQWFEEAKLERGAFATLLGFRLRTRPDAEGEGAWTAITLGDSCLFHVRDDALQVAFPLAESAAFDTSPELVPSRPDDHELVVRRATTCTGDWHSGDSFYLCTDAISAWFLAEHENGERPWRRFADLDTDGAPPFREWIADLRDAGRMRNDDVTVVRVDVL